MPFKNIFKSSFGRQYLGAGSLDPFTEVPPPQAGPELLSLPGLLALYRADVGVTSSGDVTYWADQSGHGFHLTGSATLGPTLTASDSDFNNEPALSFNGSDSRLTNDYIQQKAGSLSDQTGVTCIMFVRSNIASIKTLLEWGNTDNNSHKLRCGWSGRSEQDQFEMQNALSGSYVGKIMHDAAPFNATSSYCVITKYTKETNGACEVWTNGVYGAKAIAGTPTTVTDKICEGPLTIGANQPLASFHNMDLAELVILNQPMTSASLNTILQYGLDRYGITSGSL